MKHYGIITALLVLIYSNFAFASVCNMETSGQIDMSSGSWSVYDVNNLEILSNLGDSGDIASDLNSSISGYSFSLSGFTLLAEGSNLDPTTWTLQSQDGRMDAFSGSCSSIDNVGETVMEYDDLITLNIVDVAIGIVAFFFISALFVIKQI